ncbi:MAG: type II toxin-antitoxin system PemK/MazF family toxin [Actinomycetota bacterium]
MAEPSRSPNARTHRVVVAQGDVLWASLPNPLGSGPGLTRPVVIVQGDAFNASRLATVVVVPLTSNVRWATAPGNVLLRQRQTGLPKDSVANVSQIVAIDRSVLSEHIGRVSRAQLELILHGIDILLGR